MRARFLAAFACALAAGSATASPGVSGAGCGSHGYSYAGFARTTAGYGVAASLSALGEPLVQRGHVAAWVGVGAPGEGPNATDEWLQVGLNRIAGNTSKLYYEIARPGLSVRYVELASDVPAGRPHRVAVLEMARRPGVWRVWLDGRPASAPLYLRGSHERLSPMAIAESWDAKTPACNRYEYSFRQVEVAGGPGGSWQRFAGAQLMQDEGYRVTRGPGGSFVAASALPLPALKSVPAARSKVPVVRPG
jgi:hypothetical protein